MLSRQSFPLSDKCAPNFQAQTLYFGSCGVFYKIDYNDQTISEVARNRESIVAERGDLYVSSKRHDDYSYVEIICIYANTINVNCVFDRIALMEGRRVSAVINFKNLELMDAFTNFIFKGKSMSESISVLNDAQEGRYDLDHFKENIGDYTKAWISRFHGHDVIPNHDIGIPHDWRLFADRAGEVYSYENGGDARSF